MVTPGPVGPATVNEMLATHPEVPVRLRPQESDSAPDGAAATPRGSGGAGRPDGALYGSWSATRWQYTGRESPERKLDVVCDLGGSVTLSLSDGTYVVTWDVGHGSRSLGGAVEVDGDRITLHPQGGAHAEVLLFHLAGDTLALSSDASAWDVDGDGREEVAAFVAVLVRL
jgi:hypothetical protein